jgi:uncharacterized protein YfbU (UPF0304 family)
MSLAEKLIKDFEVLSEDKQKEVIDFVEFLKAKEKNDLYKRMDNILDQHAEAFRKLAK